MMQTVSVRKQIQRLAVGSSVLGISKTNLSQILISKPSKAEQEKIASFLSKIDSKIKVLETSYKAICSYKKGVTQKIFCQKIRFKDDDGNSFPDWEYVPLEELLTYHQPTAFLVDSTEYSDLYKTPVLTAGKTFILGYTNETSGIFTDKLPAIIFDDFTTAFKYVDFPFKVKSSAMKILVAKDDSVNLKYVFEAMSEVRFQMGNEHKRYWISEYSKLELPKPSQLEQEKISNFLSLLDSKALNCKSQLDLTKQYKQGLLQQMFV
jgi:type I restriction enzyme S subunit